MNHAEWSFVLTDAQGNALAELSTASGRTIQFTRNTYAEINLTLSHEDDAAALLLGALMGSGVPKLKAYRRSPGATNSTLMFRGPLMGISETSDESSMLTATFRSPFSVLLGDGDSTGRFLGFSQIVPLNSGSRIPTVGANDASAGSVAWSGVGSATGLPDGQWATVTVPTATPTSQYLKLTAAGFEIPETATILGIQVAIEGFAYGWGTGGGDVDVFLVDGGTVQTGSTETFTWATEGFQTWDFGGSTDMWGASWLPAQINNPGFGIAVVGTCSSGTQVQYDVDSAAIAVFYEFDGLTYSALDAGTIAKLLVDQANGQSPTGLATDANLITPTVLRDRVYPVGQNIGSAIVDLTAALDGFDFYETFVDGVGDVDAYLNVVPAQGEPRPLARFEYGPQTLSNVSSMTRTTTPPTNSIFVTGGNGLTSVFQDAASVATYGEWWSHVDFSTITDQATLDAKAASLCRTAPIKTVSFVPEVGLENCPQPFDDWGLGDTGSLYASRGALVENTQLRINGFTIPIDENGYESVQVNDPRSPEDDSVLQAKLVAEVVAT